MQLTSASAGSHANNSSLSSDDENEVSIFPSSNISSTVTTASYTLSQLEELSNTDKHNSIVIKNESGKNLPLWQWRI